MSIIAIVGLFAIHLSLTRPMSQMRTVMARLASNELAVEIVNAHRRDEIGRMAKAVHA
jgi:HAMP domain-containing protein